MYRLAQPGLLSRPSDGKNPFRTELVFSLSLVYGLEKLFALLAGFAFEVDFDVPL